MCVCGGGGAGVVVEEGAVASCRVVEREGREVVWIRRGEFGGER